MLRAGRCASPAARPSAPRLRRLLRGRRLSSSRSCLTGAAEPGWRLLDFLSRRSERRAVRNLLFLRPDGLLMRDPTPQQIEMVHRMHDTGRLIVRASRLPSGWPNEAVANGHENLAGDGGSATVSLPATVIIPNRAVSVYVNQPTSSRERRPGGGLRPTLRHFYPLSGSFAQPQLGERQHDMSFFDEIAPPGPGWTRAPRLGVGRQRARTSSRSCAGDCNRVELSAPSASGCYRSSFLRLPRG